MLESQPLETTVVAAMLKAMAMRRRGAVIERHGVPRLRSVKAHAAVRMRRAAAAVSMERSEQSR